MKRPKILYVTFSSPYPQTSGGRQRTYFIYRALTSFANVDTVIMGGKLKPENLLVLKRDFNLIHFFPTKKIKMLKTSAPKIVKIISYMAPFTKKVLKRYAVDPEISQWFSEHLKKKRYDIIVFRYYLSLAQSGVLKHNPIVLDLDDSDEQLHLSQLKAWKPGPAGAVRLLVRAYTLKILMRRHLPRCDHIWVAKVDDIDNSHASFTSVLPNIPFIQGDKPVEKLPHDSSRTLLFIGHLGVGVNIRAIDHFLKKIWPHILAECPSANLRLVGVFGKENKLKSWEAFTNVKVIGFVENPGDEYSKCSFSIAPIKEGGGTKIKVLEPLTYGRTCVVFRHSQRGYESTLKHGESLLVADSDEEFAAHCISLLNNTEKCRQLAKTGAEAVAANYNYEIFQKQIKKVVRDVIQRAHGVNIGF